MKNFDYILVGNGIAAASLLWNLRKSGKRICQIFDPEKQSASLIAAGMYNPLVFKRLTKSWKVDELLPEMLSFYTEIEHKLGTQIIFPMDIVKLLAEDEFGRWKMKMKTGDFDAYIVKVSTEIKDRGLQAFYGYGQVSNSGFVAIDKLIKGINKLADADYCIERENLKYDDIILASGSVMWKGISAKKLIFCEGAYAVYNPFFKQVPFYLTAGDLLELEIDDFQEEYILNKQIFLLPKGQRKYICGSTYNWSDLDFTQSDANRQYLLEKLNNLISVPYRVINHKTGVRPTIKDRRPVLGVHTEYPQLCYFNGLGTKGVMLAPYFANSLLNHLENELSLPDEVNIARF